MAGDSRRKGAGARVAGRLRIVSILALALAACLAGSALAAAAPVVTKLKPAEGSEAGGTKVKIGGEHLKGVTTVHFGPNTVTLAKANKSESSISVLSPAGTGTVDVTVSTPEATSETTPADRYTYVSLRPVVSKISPGQGPAKAQRTVRINGKNLSAVTAVRFGAQNASFTVVKAGTRLSATAPDTSVLGPVDVTVTTAAGTSEAVPADRYTFQPEFPSVETVSPEIGPSLETVTLAGEGFLEASKVMFGRTPAASFDVIDDTEIVAVTPQQGAERVAITITTPVGTSLAECAKPKCAPIAHYKFRPSITSISPSSGPVAGGTPITIEGETLATVTSIEFAGGRTLESLECTETACTGITPKGKEAGAAAVRAHAGNANYATEEAVSPVTEATQFTYE